SGDWSSDVCSSDLLFITTRVDVKIWSHMFNKMLNLPIDFFERTPTGDIVHHMYEIYRVRTFLTCQLFGTLLDSFVLVIFLPVLFMSSRTMTACVWPFSLLMCSCLVRILLPVGRRFGLGGLPEPRGGTILAQAGQAIR